MAQAARKLTEVQKSSQDLSREVAAAAALRQTLATMTDDADVIRDTIEGETNLHEAIARVMEFIRDDEILLTGIKSMQETLAARKDRIEKRMEFYRSAIEQALMIGQIQKLELADGTLSIRKVPAKLEVIQESEIPARFWVPSDPRLDRKALMDALKEYTAELSAAVAEGREPPPAIAGAKLGDEGITLSIRRA